MCSVHISDNGVEEKIQLIILLIRQAKVLNAPLPPSHLTKHFIAPTRARVETHSFPGKKTLYFVFIGFRDIAAE